MDIPAGVTAAASEALAEFCGHHSSPDIGDRLRYTFELVGDRAVLFEERPGFMNPAEWSSRAVAKFRYTPAKGVWGLYWSDGNGRWRRLSSAPPEKDIGKLLKIVSSDPSGVFSK